MKRSRSIQRGSAGWKRRWRLQSTKAMSAAPMGMPGWPLFAFWTASAARKRMVSTAFSASSALGMVGKGVLRGGETGPARSRTGAGRSRAAGASQEEDEDPQEEDEAEPPAPARGGEQGGHHQARHHPQARPGREPAEGEHAGAHAAPGPGARAGEHGIELPLHPRLLGLGERGEVTPEGALRGL